jgi:hypothetical protein
VGRLAENLVVESPPTRDQYTPPCEYSPEKKLLWALLFDCALCLLDRKSRRKSEALRWVRDAPALITFRFVCEILDVAPDRLRRELLRLANGGTPDFALQQYKSFLPRRVKIENR